MQIEAISVTAVRGIREEITLSLHGKSVVVRGDNGTGKSSIVCALIWALTGDRPFDQKSEQKGDSDVWRHVLSKVPARVVLSLKGGGKIDISESGVDADKAGQDLVAACRRASPFLVRKQLLRFLEDRPADRFRYLDGFLDLSRADAAHEAFSARAKKHEGELEVHEGQLRTLVTKVFGESPQDLDVGEAAWPRTVARLLLIAAKASIHPAPTDWASLKERVTELRPVLQGEHLARRRAALQAVRERLHATTSTSSPDDDAPVVEQLNALEPLAGDASIADLLRRAVQHIEANADAQSCPVCKQVISPISIASELRARLGALSEIEMLRARRSAISADWLRRGRQLGATFQDAAKALGVESYDKLPSAPPMPTHAVETQDASHDAPASLQTHAARFRAEEGTSVEFLLDRVDTQLLSLPAEANVEVLRNLIAMFERAEQSELAIRLAADGVKASGGLAETFRQLSEDVRRNRQDVAKELLSQISSLVSDYYRRVHADADGGDATGAPKIEVQRHAKGSAHVRGEFNNTQVDDPRLLYSDGHLDTVGICVFLALRKFRAQRERGARIMVLDDIVLSVDLGHGRRLLDLLKQEFSDHQVFIFTHNGLFFEWCASHLPSYERRVINRWTLESGPQLGDYPSAIERLKTAIEREPAPKLLAQSVMNLMDEWLAEARVVYEVAVPARRGDEYTLSEIWQPFVKQMSELAKAWKVDIGETQNSCGALKEDLPKMRNRLAAHENDFAKEFPLSAVRNIASQCLVLIRSLYCEKCSRFAECVPRPREAEMLRCNCESLRYIKPQKAQS